MQYKEIENLAGFVRDTQTNVVVNTNKAEIQAARRRKELLREEKNRQASLASDVEDLKTEMKEMKSLLVQLVNGHNSN